MDLHVEDFWFAVDVLFGTGFASANGILGLEVGRIVDKRYVEFFLSVLLASWVCDMGGHVVDYCSKIVGGVGFARYFATEISEIIV